ncbi:YsnF/AvaK domain-containing protein [Gordonia sp. TBRC 11910]|uniref:YsnF/AvaK domain-containing protein n=1 Tax=Gordonia asplenii TaxID=2725283 RepID=A0A848LA01_9ACTN|nr:YsnF/AvaK domain-containing protein [Gordonia asplenii]NMO05281.1 YsnF/AvaK domain-containing protein [Gordonia asplenii]
MPEADPDVVTVALHAEFLTAEKREVVTGKAQVRKTIETESAEVNVDVEREHADVTRVAVDNRVVTSAPEPYWDGDTYVVPVVEEELIVTKRLVVREEVRIRRVRGTETVSVPATVRRERVEVTEIDVNTKPGKHSQQSNDIV